ncbi:MAG TPA: 6-phosphofructokinase [Planctomycetes bacterium]|nr:6-phosphofructokinase [Planctomycetota bacterium]
MSSPRGNALIGQSGGPTCVINQSLVGVVEASRDSDRIENVYGALHGVQGILDENFVDLGRETQETLERVAVTPCAALRSVRKKPTREECAKVLEVFRRHDIRYFFYIGGNDSAETAHLLNEIAVAEGYDVRLFHVPKTIDNDLRVTDHCPGYGSAARFVASAIMGDNQDNRSLPGIKIDVIMGRHAGWLTAASLLAREHEDDGPHLIYVPERVFDLERFVADVDEMYTRHGRCLVAASEGIHDADGNPIFSSKEVDSHGNVQLSGSGALGDFLAATVKEKLGSKLRVRADTFGYLQRSFAGHYSEVDAREAREVGRTAVRVATSGEAPHGSIVILRKDGPVYEVSFGCTELSNVAKVTRDLDEAYIKGDRDIAPAFLDYVRPLVGTMPSAGRLSDFPVGG